MQMLGNDSALRISFLTAAENLKIIDDNSFTSVLVRYEEGEQLIATLRSQGPERHLLRRAQRFVVNLPRYIAGRLIAEGAIEEIHPGILVQGYGNLYDLTLGFCADRSLVREPDELMI